MKKLLLLTTLLNSIILFAQMPTNGLKVYYPFNKNVNDESGNGQNGTKYNITLAKDRFGKDSSAYYFNGNTNSYIEIPVISLLNNTYTYSVWTKLKTFPSYNAMTFILNIGGFAGDNSIGICNYYTPEAYHGWVGGGYNTSSPNFGLQDKSFSLNYEWNHIVCVRHSKYALLYVNGILVDSLGRNDVSFPSYGNNSKALIGIRNNFDTPYNGWIDDVAIYDRPLSKKEVLSLYNFNPNTSIPDFNINSELTLFPNPSSENSFQIKSNVINLNQSEIEIINAIGQVQSFEISNKDNFSIEIKHQFSKGIYFVTIKNNFSEPQTIKLQID